MQLRMRRFVAAGTKIPDNPHRYGGRNRHVGCGECFEPETNG